VSVQTGPALHDRIPVRHALSGSGVQVEPSAHATQLCAEQTWSVPQGVPSGAPTQLPQTPPQQTWSMPQLVPSVTGVCSQTGLPDPSQAIAASWQASMG
jgi:hypothetical protein